MTEFTQSLHSVLAVLRWVFTAFLLTSFDYFLKAMFTLSLEYVYVFYFIKCVL